MVHVTLVTKNFIDKFLKTNKPSRLEYKILIDKKPFDSNRKWNTDCILESDETIDWKAVHRMPFLLYAQKFQLTVIYFTEDW